MTSTTAAPNTDPAAETSGSVRHRQLGPVVVSAAITIAVFLQAPGRLVPETKLDLVVDPADFLRRALHLWDSRAAFGQIPNQSPGYLFPMGPFYALGHAQHVPMWLVQRSWMSVLLVAALFGVLRVADALRIGTPGTRLVAAAAYAVSPVMLTSIAHASGGLIPAALAPWALLPLVHADRGGPIRRGAARSGVAIAAMGGINAVSVLGGVAVPALWLVTRRGGRRRRALLAWWILAVALGCLWWVVAGLLQARYGLHFQQYTETAGQTTATTSTIEVLRGTGYWLGYFFTKGPWLRAGWELASRPAIILATSVLAGVGLGGIARRDAPERLFLGVSVGLGLAIVVSGYGGPLSGPLSGVTRTALDGPLSFLRNLDKFQPMIRLPLALGLGHALGKVRSPVLDSWVRTIGWRAGDSRRLAAGVAGVAVAIAALPLLDGHVTDTGTFSAIPAYWRQTAAWLATHDAAARSLVIPGAAFAEDTWGRPLDEPLQSLSRSPWAVRDLIPLGSDGATRLLDAIESRIGDGRPDPGLAPVLARSGVGHLVVRNDLDLTRVDAPPPFYVRQALSASPGLALAATFGPIVPCGLRADRLPIGGTVNATPCHAVEIYDVRGQVQPFALYPAAATTVVSGDPQSLFTLADNGLLPDGATVLAGDPAGTSGVPPAGWTVTDAVRRLNQNFGAIRNAVSYSLTADEPVPGSHDTPRQRVVVPGIQHQSVIEMTGAIRLSASSYGALGQNVAGNQPYAAFDGDPDTAWVADGAAGAVGQWIEVQLAQPLDVRRLTVRLLADGSRLVATRLTITTDRGSVNRPVADTEDPQVLATPRGLTTRIRITISGATSFGVGGSGVGIREIDVPGLKIERSLAVPNDFSGPTPTFVFERARSQPDQIGAGDEDARLARTFVTDVATTYEITGLATPRPGAPLDQLLWPSSAGGFGLTVSSTWGSLPAYAGANMLDGDPATAWVADPRDPTPSVELSWPGSRSISSIQLVPPSLPALAPVRVRLLTASGLRDVSLDRDGVGRFPPLITDHLTLTFPRSKPTGAAAEASGGVGFPAVGVAELRLPEVPHLFTTRAALSTVVHLPCGQGPSVLVDGQEVPTSETGTVRDLVMLQPLTLHGCAPLSIGPLSHHLIAGSSAWLSVDELTLRVQGAPVSSASTARVAAPARSADDRTITVGPGDASYVALTQNFNRGWQATFNGHALRPVRVDGWRQAWLVPAGAGGLVHIRFAPDTVYRWSLVFGSVAILALLALALARGEGDGHEGGPATPPAAFLIALAIIVVGWVSGPLVLLVPAVLLAANEERLAAIGEVAIVLAGGFAAVDGAQLPGSTHGAFGAPAQLLAVLAVAIVMVSLVPEDRRRGSRGPW